MSESLSTKLKKQIGGKSLSAKIIGWALLGAIGIVFVFFSGVGGGMGMLGMGSVARVNDSLISAADLQSEESRIQEYYSNLFGGGMDLSSQRNMLRQQALETLIRSELASQAAREEGIRASDDEVRDLIVKDIPVFQENGQFLRERYLGYLQATRMSAGDFEARLRKDIETVRVRQLLEAASFPMNLELEKMKELQSQKMNISFARVDAERMARGGTQVTNAEAEAALAKEDFQKKAQDYFQAYKGDWSQPETATAQHILISVAPNSPEADKAALEKIKGLQERAKKEDFGKLAAQFSEDPGSKSKNGRLDPFTRGKMVKEFEEAAFSQKIGEVGNPVKTPFGYHLIKVTQRTVASEAKFDDVKVEVARRLLARDRVDERLKELDEAVQKGESARVDQILSGLGVKWEETGLFDLSGAVPKLPAGPVAEAAFEVQPGKPLLSRVIRDGGSRYVLKLKETKRENAPTIAAGEPSMMQKRRSEALFASWLEDFRADSRVDVNPQVYQQ